MSSEEETAEAMAEAALTATSALSDLVSTLCQQLPAQHGLRGIAPAMAVIASLRALAERTLDVTLSQSRAWAGYEPIFEDLTREEVARLAAWIYERLKVHVDARPLDEAIEREAGRT